MQVFGLLRQFHYLSKYCSVELSAGELDRLRALGLWQETGDVKLACQTFGFSRATLYRWKRCFDSKDLSSLKDRSRCPHRRRQPSWSLELIEAVKRLKETYPRWGKDKLPEVAL